MLRLLEKKEIDRQRALEDKLRIDEGTRIAKRVDRLRELSVDTEASYKSYRDTALKEIQSEIDAKILEKNELEALLLGLRRERERLEQPPDLTEAWSRISRETEQLAFRKQTFEERERNLSSREKSLHQLQKEVDERDEIVMGREKMLSQDWREAERMKKQASQTLLEAENRFKDVDSDEKRRKNILEKKEAEISARESKVILREKDSDRREKEIISQTRFLADQRETLRRAMNRL